ncbi:DsrE family protein [Algoriphagus resistens]|uniref:DsrE family protein n=1 Tax=Algoriphagus resistens TaxID=1750590 RepID=UPI00071694B3|nr:DsrE family protein [Algoriphagus resistens]
MKKLWFLIPLLAVTLTAMGQSERVKILFDLTSKDPAVHQATIRHVTAMSEAYPDAEFEVVMYGGGVFMVVPEQSSVTKEVRELVARDNVKFVVCEMGLKRHQLQLSNLIPGVGSVPDGILELVQKQAQGWGYIKEGGL